MIDDLKHKFAAMDKRTRLKYAGLAVLLLICIWRPGAQPAQEVQQAQPARAPMPELTERDLAAFKRCMVNRTDANYWLSQRRGDWHPSGDMSEAQDYCIGRVLEQAERRR
jgi:hypothetical protein